MISNNKRPVYIFLIQSVAVYKRSPLRIYSFIIWSWRSDYKSSLHAPPAIILDNLGRIYFIIRVHLQRCCFSQNEWGEHLSSSAHTADFRRQLFFFFFFSRSFLSPHRDLHFFCLPVVEKAAVNAKVAKISRAHFFRAEARLQSRDFLREIDSSFFKSLHQHFEIYYPACIEIFNVNVT